MQVENHIFQGLKRDNHPIRQKAEFLWDAHNIRLTNREDNTLLSITNERGTKDTGVYFSGEYVGHCIVGRFLVIFTSLPDYTDCRIYRIEKDDDAFNSIILFEKEGKWEDGWDVSNPIETIGLYETELIQKVYWVDGVHQPRVINITKPELRINKKYITDGLNLSVPESNPTFIKNFLLNNYPNGFYDESQFDFVRELELREEVEVNKIYGQGEFSPGTIQYAFSYYNKYEQETNICYTTPLYYISPSDRGGKPGDKISCAFTLRISNVDTRFEYLRVYSINRTSLDATPAVKLVTDIFINKESTLSYTDNGDMGSDVDPTQLLYIGGRSIVPNTIAAKDGTLFLGNYGYLQKIRPKTVKSYLQASLVNASTKLVGTIDSTNTYYKYQASLDDYNSAGFKCGETYRYGIQCQYKDGEWSEPIYLGDAVLCDDYPWMTYPYRTIKAIRLDYDHLYASLSPLGIKRLRACVVLPKASQREILCQGVLCPTLRKADNSWTYYSSWFFRPTADSRVIDSGLESPYNGSMIEFRHNKSLFTGGNRGAEIQDMIAATWDGSTTGGGNGFIVDENVVTLNSPDIEFDSNTSYTDFTNAKLRIIGMASMGAVYGDIDIETSTPGANPDGYGRVTSPVIGYKTTNQDANRGFKNNGLTAGLFYTDSLVGKTYGDDGSANYYAGDGHFFMVYPWNRSGSVNNDENRGSTGGTRSAVLSKKKISNLKFFDKNYPLGTDTITYNISTPQLFNSEELSLLKLSPSYINRDIQYLGNVDTLITATNSYAIYGGKTFEATPAPLTGDETIKESKEPVRIKYKSAPHLVFSLSDDNLNKINLLPIYGIYDDGTYSDAQFKMPSWMLDSNEEVTDMVVDGALYRVSGESELPSYEGAEIYNKYALSYIDGEYKLYRGSESFNSYIWEEITAKSISNKGIILSAGGCRVKQGFYLPDTESSNYVGNVDDRYAILNTTCYFKITTEGSPQNKQIVVTNVTSQYVNTSTNVFTLDKKTFGTQAGTFSSNPPYLLIGELYRDRSPEEKYGEDGDEGTENIWYPAGPPVNLVDGESLGLDQEESSPKLLLEYGDTWYSRYDCLKTYPYTQEDENQVVEIGSFMCETRVNIDGRYDRNRGQLSNLNMTPQNFNLMNDVYTQKDNFFSSRVLDDDFYNQDRFTNQVTWTKQKTAGEDTDTWANLTLASTLDMNGERGKINSLTSWNDFLLCFQDKAVSLINFNSRAQIPVSDGVPIEISNNYKVDGSKSINDNVGCQNKWSIVNSIAGVYFIDNETNTIWLYNGQLSNLSETNGMKWWLQENHTTNIWSPKKITNNSIRSFYDPSYRDVYFSFGTDDNQKDALCYSEQLQQFTSQMSYGGVAAMFNYEDGFFTLKNEDGILRLWENFKGDYNNFYGTYEPWSFTFISNENPMYTKVFDTLEFRSDVWKDTTLLQECPVDYIQASNEYQDSGEVKTQFKPSDYLKGKLAMKKFRIWRAFIPRDGRNRIRNPWTKIKLGWTPNKNNKTNKMVFHDLSIKYVI